MSGLNRNGKGFIIFPQPKHSAKLLPPPYDETPRISKMGLLLMLLCRGVQGAALVLCLESRSRSGSQQVRLSSPISLESSRQVIPTSPEVARAAAERRSSHSPHQGSAGKSPVANCVPDDGIQALWHDAMLAQQQSKATTTDTSEHLQPNVSKPGSPSAGASIPRSRAGPPFLGTTCGKGGQLSSP